jgi:hypothetical protein
MAASRLVIPASSQKRTVYFAVQGYDGALGKYELKCTGTGGPTTRAASNANPGQPSASLSASGGPDRSSPSEDNDAPVGSIVVGVIGGTVAVAMVALLAAFVIKKRRTQLSSQQGHKLNTVETDC